MVGYLSKRKKHQGEKPNTQGDNSLRGQSLGRKRGKLDPNSFIYSIYSQAAGAGAVRAEREPLLLASRVTWGLFGCYGFGLQAVHLARWGLSGEAGPPQLHLAWPGRLYLTAQEPDALWKVRLKLWIISGRKPRVHLHGHSNRQRQVSRSLDQVSG